jgi:hypothetical protein
MRKAGTQGREKEQENGEEKVENEEYEKEKR